MILEKQDKINMLQNAQGLLLLLNIASGIKQKTDLDFKAIIFTLSFDSFSEKSKDKNDLESTGKKKIINFLNSGKNSVIPDQPT